MTDAIRPWCAVAKFPGMEPFLMGTVTLPAGARQDEIEAALQAHGKSMLPDGFAILDMKCGALFFHGETP